MQMRRHVFSAFLMPVDRQNLDGENAVIQKMQLVRGKAALLAYFLYDDVL